MRVVSKADQLEQEARSLWIEVFGEPPAAGLNGQQILDLSFSRIQPPSYARLNSAARARNLHWPQARRSS
jgi:hypothetical protein